MGVIRDMFHHWRHYMDIKGMYQDKAEELADSMYGLEFYALGEVEQAQVYTMAIDIVNDSIATTADALLEIDKYRCRGR